MLLAWQPPAAGEGPSAAVRAGALRCGLRAALKLAAEPHLRAALQRAGAAQALQARCPRPCWQLLARS